MDFKGSFSSSAELSSYLLLTPLEYFSEGILSWIARPGKIGRRGLDTILLKVIQNQEGFHFFAWSGTNLSIARLAARAPFC